MCDLNFNCFNARGLAESKKRRAVFHWIKRFHNGVTFLQETHCSVEIENAWKRDWQGEIIFNHGTPHSCGVAILFPKNVEYITNCIKTDDNGRFLLVDIDIGGENMILVNVYAPTKDKANEQEEFLAFLQRILILIGGDFNTYLDPVLDKKGGIMEKRSKFASGLHEMMEEYNLSDIFRVINPTVERFTWRGNTKKGVVQSRLDYWLVSSHMLYNLQSIDIKPGIKSDHSLLNINFQIKPNAQRGKGFWKFNSSLLRDEEYIKRIKQTLEECKVKYYGLEQSLRWEMIKCELRSTSISYASWKVKMERNHECRLLNELRELERTIESSNENLKQYNSIKLKVEQIVENKSRGTFIRSCANYIEQGEKCTKYFLHKEINNSKKKHIKCLITDEGTIYEPSLILDKQKEYYSRLYTQNEYNICDGECDFFKTDFPKLNEKEVNICDKIITLVEIGKGLSELPNNKAPGTDGFTTDFYKFFWKDIKNLVFESFISAFAKSTLSVEQRRAILTLLPKGEKDIRYLKNWRPLSLLNTDYKILTKTLALRLQKVLPSLIDPNQTGCMKNRYIGENLRILLDIIQYSNSNQNQRYHSFFRL